MQFKLKAIDLNAIKSIRKVVFALMAMTREIPRRKTAMRAALRVGTSTPTGYDRRRGL